MLAVLVTHHHQFESHSNDGLNHLIVGYTITHVANTRTGFKVSIVLFPLAEDTINNKNSLTKTTIQASLYTCIKWVCVLSSCNNVGTKIKEEVNLTAVNNARKNNAYALNQIACWDNLFFTKRKDAADKQTWFHVFIRKMANW